MEQLEQINEIIKKLESDSKPEQSELKGLLKDVMDSIRQIQPFYQADNFSDSAVKTKSKKLASSTASSSPTPSTMETISKDIIELIFNHLSPEQRVIASRCCRKWRELVISRGSWWGTGKFPVLVKRILNLDQANQIISFLRTHPNFNFRLFVMNPFDSNQQVSLVKIVFVQRGSLILRFLSSNIVREVPDASIPLNYASTRGNFEIFHRLSEELGFFWPTVFFSVKRMVRRSHHKGLDGICRLVGWRMGGPASPFTLFQRIREEKSSVHALNFNGIALVQSEDEDIPMLPTKEVLTSLHTLLLPTGMPPSIFFNFLLPNLRNLYGDSNSLMNMNFALEKVQILGVKLEIDEGSWDGEILKLLGILTMTPQLRCLKLTQAQPMKSKSKLDFNCLLNLLLQIEVSSETFDFSWCPSLNKILGFGSLECSQQLVLQLHQLKEEKSTPFQIVRCTLI